jgi:flagellar protein FliS
MAYERAVQSYRKTSVETADQLKLIIMCYEEAIQAIKQAKICYEQRDFEKKTKHLAKAQDIIHELLSSLNREKGGIIAVNLASLYGYTLNRLARGDLEQDMNAFDEVTLLLAELLTSWQEIASDKNAKAKLPKSIETAAVTSRGIAV